MLISILDYLKVSSINYPMKTAVREEENMIKQTRIGKTVAIDRDLAYKVRLL